MAGEEYLAGGMLAALAGMLVFVLIFIIIAYVLSAIALMKIANKTNTPNAWLAWIPIANIFLMVFVAEKEWWWALIILLAGLVPIVGGIASLVVMIYIWWLITERLGKSGPLALLMLLPGINLIYMLYLAFSD